MNDGAKILASLLVGLAAGVVVGILFAPDKGNETREKLTESIKDAGECMKDWLNTEVGDRIAKIGKA